MPPQMRNDCVMKAEIESGERPDVSSTMAEKMKALDRENRELRQANKILCKAPVYFAPFSRFETNRCRASGRNSTTDTRHDGLHRRS